MEEPNYTPRVVDAELTTRLQSVGAVVLEGPKACGKTETARQRAASEVLLDVDDAARAAAAVDPSLILAGAVPRLIDEWQVEPAIWAHVRREVDDRAEPGQFILAGSATPSDDATRHSGAGRVSRLRMRPMALAESGASTGAISLADLMDGGSSSAPEPDLTVRELAVELSRGGWPGTMRLPVEAAIEAVRPYLDEVRRTDISSVDGVRRDPERVERVLRSLARNIATPVSLNTLARDAGGSDGLLDRETIGEYLSSLARLFVVEDQPSWGPHLRTTHTLRKAAKRHFVDPSLAVAALRTGPEGLLRDLNFMGCVFESLVVRDLRVYCQKLGGEVMHYRDSDGLEVDAIVTLADGRWAAFEVKLGARAVDDAAKSLERFRGRVDVDRSGKPVALGVIVATGYGYTRPDGIHVIPIAALGP